MDVSSGAEAANLLTLQLPERLAALFASAASATSYYHYHTTYRGSNPLLGFKLPFPLFAKNVELPEAKVTV